MAVKTSWTAGEVLTAADLTDTFASKAPTASPTFTGTVALPSTTTLSGSTLNLPGFVKIADAAFTAVSSVVVANCFSATYLTYKILIQISASSSVDKSIFLKLRAGGTDSSNFYNSFIAAGTRGGTVSNLAQFDDTNGYKLGEIDSTETGNNFAVDMNLFGPFVNDRSQMTINTAFVDVGGNFRYGAGAGQRNSGTSHDSLNLIASAGTITGTIRVYGYRN